MLLSDEMAIGSFCKKELLMIVRLLISTEVSKAVGYGAVKGSLLLFLLRCLLELLFAEGRSAQWGCQLVIGMLFAVVVGVAQCGAANIRLLCN